MRSLFLNNLYIFLIYIFLNEFNYLLLNFINFIFSFQDQKFLSAYMIYLPHGVRVIGYLVGGINILPGLFLAHLYSAINFVNFASNDFLFIFGLSIGATICVLLAVLLLYRRTQVKFFDLKLKNILLIVILSSLINSYLSYFLRVIFKFDFGFELETFLSPEILKFLTGDIIGALFLFFLVTGLRKLKII